MTDAQEITGNKPAVMLAIGGEIYPLLYKMAAVGIYQAETARIEGSRPQIADQDPTCLCGAKKSLHEGPDLIRLDGDKGLICWRFRLDDRLRGDSLFLRRSWDAIDPQVDPERWQACLWAGLHQLQPDGKTWKAPITLAQLGGMIPLGPEIYHIHGKLMEALSRGFPLAKEPVPNVDAPGEPALTK